MRTLRNQVLAWQQDYMLPFIFCDSRRSAESTALYWMKRYWLHQVGLKKKRESDDIDAAIAAL
jgi:hypothetical protein